MNKYEYLSENSKSISEFITVYSDKKNSPSCEKRNASTTEHDEINTIIKCIIESIKTSDEYYANNLSAKIVASDTIIMFAEKLIESRIPECNGFQTIVFPFKTLLMKYENPKTKYGWLSTDGTFNECEWGCHENWARQYLSDSHKNKDYQNFALENKHISYSDYMIYKLNWILIHSPDKSAVTHLCSNNHNMTKSQKEFLYDYYSERNMLKEANDIYNE